MNTVDGADAASQAASIGFKGAIAGSAALGWGGWTSNDLAMAVGALVAIAGLAVQIHFKRREHQLRVAEHQMLRREHLARMSELEA